ncbi:MAG: hypothetical protein KAX49_03025 [Halanaerobiales bacterium]|nr:hypothetical protein [Halanaerobiales bacterium]
MSKTKIGIIINYLALILFVTLFTIGKKIDWNVQIVIGVIATILIIIICFIKVYLKSSLWKLVHRPQEKLNEKEKSTINTSIRKSYQIFSITTLTILFVYALAETKIGMELVVSLIYFAHTLPSSLIAWTEKEIC